MRLLKRPILARTIIFLVRFDLYPAEKIARFGSVKPGFLKKKNCLGTNQKKFGPTHFQKKMHSRFRRRYIPMVTFSFDLRRLSSLKKTILGSGFPPTLQTKVTVSPSSMVTLISCSISMLGGTKSKSLEAVMHTN